MKVYITPEQDRAMIAFVKARGIVFLPKGKKLPGIRKNKRIIVPLYSMEEIASRSPGLAQEIERYSAIASAASDAEKMYNAYRAYLIKKVCLALGIKLARGKSGEVELAQNLKNLQIPRVRVFTQGQEENVFVISAVAEQSRAESVRTGGKRVMFIKDSPSTARATDFRRVAKGWDMYIPEKSQKDESLAVRCPLRFVEEYEVVYQDHKRLDDERRKTYQTITQVYADLEEMAVKTERGIFVFYSVPPTVVSAHYRPPSLRVLFVGLAKEPKKDAQDQQGGAQDSTEPN